jgi:hypothetical protein
VCLAKGRLHRVPAPNERGTPSLPFTLSFPSLLYRTTAHNNPDHQIARAKEIKSHFLQQQAHELGDARKAADVAAKGVIVSLGLVKPVDDSGSESDK